MTGLLWLAGPARAEFDLATALEARLDRQAAELPQARAVSAPGAPRIELLAPSIGKPLASPIDIRVRWAALDGASIDPRSVRVRYGRLGLDVTARVLGAARVTAAGIEAPGAVLPAGEHRLSIEIADSQQRTSRQDFVVEIVN